jgi:hypothetical protein
MQIHSKHAANNQQGSIIVSILVVTIVFSTMLFGLVILANANMSRARGRILLLQAQYAAESGADAAIATLNTGNDTYTGTVTDTTILNTTQYKSTYSVTVANGSTGNERIITATGKVYSPKTASVPTNTRTIRVVSQRSTSSTAGSLTSRNIIAIDSGVKNLTARDIFVNGFITMAKNTTNLIAENITVAGKNTGSTNCSIGGTGNLLKPTTFTTPGQTKTNIVLGYNNCLSPPGNSSNANFNVTANSGSITSVQSTYVPWTQYMSTGYVDAGSCTDWTSGGTTRNIPSITNSKKTQYPDSSSNIATTCGTAGDLALGSNTYNINDNVHLRANLCAATACTPTFNNPTATIKYVFVEGTINFASINTPTGSGPIAFMTYGADPASKTSVCPYGGSIYLGSSGSSNAPAVYFLATNGVCIDKTKFDTDPALGGLGGKNLYIASNPGTPKDLALDPNFPVSSIPINLSWRAIRYERL